MAVFAGILDLVVVVFLVLVFAEYTKLRQRSKGFYWLASGGILFLLAGTFMSAHLNIWSQVKGAIAGQWLFEFLGWLFVLIGALVIVSDLAKQKK